MTKFLLWCLLLVLCWPLAVLAVVLYPFVWLLLLPFRLVGIAVCSGSCARSSSSPHASCEGPARSEGPKGRPPTLFRPWTRKRRRIPMYREGQGGGRRRGVDR